MNTRDFDPADWLEVIQVINRSAGLDYDDGDFAALAELWAEDATFDVEPKPEFTSMPLHGRDAIFSMMSGRQPIVYATEPRRHVITNVVVDSLTSDVARCRSYMTLFSMLKSDPDGSFIPMGMATYYDELVKTDRGWVIQSRLSVLFGGSFSTRPDSRGSF